MSSDIGPETTGHQIERRRVALGISVAELARRAGGMDRDTVRQAIDDNPRTRATTTGALLATLDRLEEEMGMGDTGAVIATIDLPDGGHLTFRGDPKDVAESAERLVRRLYPDRR